MHGACQTRPALSHHHTLIQTLYHTYMNAHRGPEASRLAWVETEIYVLIRSVVMTVPLTTGFPPPGPKCVRTEPNPSEERLLQVHVGVATSQRYCLCWTDRNILQQGGTRLLRFHLLCDNRNLILKIKEKKVFLMFFLLLDINFVMLLGRCRWNLLLPPSLFLFWILLNAAVPVDLILCVSLCVLVFFSMIHSYSGWSHWQ